MVDRTKTILLNQGSNDPEFGSGRRQGKNCATCRGAVSLDLLTVRARANCKQADSDPS